MSAIEVMKEIKALPPAEQERLVRLLAEETDWLEDVVDAAIARARLDEPERPVELFESTANGRECILETEQSPQKLTNPSPKLKAFY